MAPSDKIGISCHNFIVPGYLERTRVLDFVGAAFSRDRFYSRLKAAPTSVFFRNLDLPDKRIILMEFLRRNENIEYWPEFMPHSWNNGPPQAD